MATYRLFDTNTTAIYYYKCFFLSQRVENLLNSTIFKLRAMFKTYPLNHEPYNHTHLI